MRLPGGDPTQHPLILSCREWTVLSWPVGRLPVVTPARRDGCGIGFRWRATGSLGGLV
jgi:hypothetical protein